MEELYFTIAGCSHYFGSDFMEKGMKVKLEKEPDNKYDKEAIQVKIKGLGKIGYVANSPFTVKGESMSAGRLYDKIGDKAKGKVVLDCQHFFRQIFSGYFPDIVQAFDTLGRNVYGDDYTSLHNPIVLSSVLLVYGMFHSTQILF